ncbi:MAG: holo-ACP synthase [Acidimicrobiales bacterium]
MIGIGTDLVDIDRFRATLVRTPGMRTRLFCDAELAYADASGDPARPLAARFAAKEAVLKSLGSGLGAMRFTDIEIIRHGDGHPELVLHGDAVEYAAGKGAHRFLVSLTHTDTLAQAVVVALA